ncbi:isochorismatase family protein [Daejeonella sp.]|jgi:nicotinamidase-related amidase|uniref:isochorismatase family protein n=1 Tax=Daejeonella sp. TaxID=2805397 RepID=UPI0027BB20BD|nr:isochorismatase family protein [Daejeonella sp.]
MSNKNNSRRDFLKKTSLGGLGTALGVSVAIPTFASLNTIEHSVSAEKLHVKPRYHRWHVNEGAEWLELNTGHANLDWNIPVSQCALVLLDVWSRHYLKEPTDRAEKIINEKYIPLLKKCRESGMTVIHAPSPQVAIKHPNWVKLISDEELNPLPDAWPPREFRGLSGPYKDFRRPFEPREVEIQAMVKPHQFHPIAMPMEGEGVIATGEELHRYCKQKGILFLFFAGFNTNACMITRDYGALQMNTRGYQVSVLRDCTTGMENKETQAKLLQTNGALLFFEMFGQYTVTSDEIITGFSGKA